MYLQELDYTSVIEVAESGLELIRRHEKDTGRKINQWVFQFPKSAFAITTSFRVRKAFNVSLAAALVHLYPPKHHARALRLLDDVLTFDANNVDALVGRGYIFQHTGKWEEARALFDKATSLLPPETLKSIRAKEESAWCLSKIQVEQGVQALKEVLKELQGDEHDMDRARCLWRIGKGCWEMGGWSTPPHPLASVSYLERSRLS